MARYTANLRLPVDACHAGPHGVSAALSQALLASGLDLEQATRLQVAASASPGDPWPLSFRLVISWTAALPSAQASDLSLEVLSREPMATGGPSTRAAFEQVLAALQQHLPGLHVTQSSTATATAISGAD